MWHCLLAHKSQALWAVESPPSLRIMGEDLVWITPGRATSHNWSFHQFTVFILNAIYAARNDFSVLAVSTDWRALQLLYNRNQAEPHKGTSLLSNKGPGAHLNTSGSCSEVCRSGQLAGVSKRLYLSFCVTVCMCLNKKNISLEMSSFLNKQNKFLLGVSPFPLHPNHCKLRFSFFHLNVTIA